ncbi:MAG: radical SAM protein [Methanomassiliicoccales archaeon]|nr:radical SAM protein [Methanomassiliicoccales archaeon]
MRKEGDRHFYKLLPKRITDLEMSIVYGPVRSWKIGTYLGVDPIYISPKVCSLNCIYCELGEGGILGEQKCQFIQTKVLMEELEHKRMDEVDLITFSGTGEPMLASNLKEMAEAIKARKNVSLAILTNSCHFLNNGSMEALEPFDIVIAKLDAATGETFNKVNRPHSSISFERVLEGIRMAAAEFPGSFRLQLMFMEANKNEVDQLGDLCNEIDPDVIYLNTPLRRCGISPLKEADMQEIRKHFRDFRLQSVF